MKTYLLTFITILSVFLFNQIAQAQLTMLTEKKENKNRLNSLANLDMVSNIVLPSMSPCGIDTGIANTFCGKFCRRIECIRAFLIHFFGENAGAKNTSGEKKLIFLEPMQE